MFILWPNDVTFVAESVDAADSRAGDIGLQRSAMDRWPGDLARTRAGRVRRRLRRLDWVDADQSTWSNTKYNTFFSPTIGRNVSYLIYLPPDYATAGQHYPVIYWLHSNGGNQREGAGVFVPQLDRAIRSGQAPPTIAVLL